ncbi:hypothetical protein EYF80_010540 [Liparis tanakae]|uniref:Uncharacterized protein n=1 Tax=Liparis tanakae TaxID=230148 RepID=A0A4Z2IN53_9TELE|nr:hypothetical protein EYF80_010540 [Liparis tanakae]
MRRKAAFEPALSGASCAGANGLCSARKGSSQAAAGATVAIARRAGRDVQNGVRRNGGAGFASIE